MKKLLFLAFFGLFLAFSASAQTVAVTAAADSTFSVSFFFERVGPNDDAGNTYENLDSAQVKKMLADQSAALANRIAERKLELFQDEKDQAKINQQFRAFAGETVEDAISPTLRKFWVGTYVFKQGGVKKTLKITEPTSPTARLRARIDGATTGTLKIESMDSATALNSFTNAAGASIDVQLLRGDGEAIYAIVDGVRIRLPKRKLK